MKYLAFPLSLITGLLAAYQLMSSGVSAETAGMVVALAVIALVVALERWLPYPPQRHQPATGTRADVWSLILVAGGVETVIAALAPVAALAVYSWMLSQGWHGSVFPTHWPVFLQLVLLVLLSDLGKYWLHRAGHETRWGWRLHSVHHAVKRVYWLNGFRIHPLYHVLNFVLGILPWLCLGVSKEVMALYTVTLAVSAAFQHANADLKHGWLNWVFNTNELHRWHHSRHLPESNANYGAILVVWDVLFGTHRPAHPGAPAEFGMVHEDGYPMESYGQQLLVPFRARWWRDVESRPHA